MKTWYEGFLDWWNDGRWHDPAVYGFTVVCVFLGDYILHGTRPEIGWLPLTGACVSSVIICGVVELFRGKVDTPEKRAGKKKTFTARVVVSGLAGLGSSAVIPVLIKKFMGTIGVDL